MRKRPKPRAKRPPRKPRQDARRARNHRLLVDAALRLVGEEGAASLSVARVTRAIGMGASGFYAHFKSIEECEQAAADAFREYLQSHLVPYQALRAASDVTQTVRAYEALMRSWLARPEWFALLHRRTYEESPFGAAIRALMQTVRDDLSESLWERATAAGMRGAHVRDFQFLAEMCIAHFNIALSQVMERGPDAIPQLALTLARADFAITMDFVAQLQAARNLGARGSIDEA